MKVLKDPGQVLEIMIRKLNKLREKFDEADGEEASEISGQEVAISSIAEHIRRAIEDHGCFGAEDIARVYDYVDNAEGEANKYHRNPRDTWFMEGLAKGATWARARIEYRLEEERGKERA